MPRSTGLKELRDTREVQTLGLLVDAISAGEYARAVDVAAQRIKAVQRAKDPKSNWEKASLLELLPTSSTGAALEGEISLAA